MVLAFMLDTPQGLKNALETADYLIQKCPELTKGATPDEIRFILEHIKQCIMVRTKSKELESRRTFALFTFATINEGREETIGTFKQLLDSLNLCHGELANVLVLFRDMWEKWPNPQMGLLAFGVGTYGGRRIGEIFFIK
jgi:hypothetical protein